MPKEAATLIPAHPLAEHPFSAAKIPPATGYVRIHDSHGGSHDLPVQNIANAQKIDPDLRLDLSNVLGFRVIGKVVSATEAPHPAPHMNIRQPRIAARSPSNRTRKARRSQLLTSPRVPLSCHLPCRLFRT